MIHYENTVLQSSHIIQNAVSFYLFAFVFLFNFFFNFNYLFSILLFLIFGPQFIFLNSVAISLVDFLFRILVQDGFVFSSDDDCWSLSNRNRPDVTFLHGDINYLRFVFSQPFE